MISILFAAAVLSPTVADYFPLAPGTKWMYEERVGKMSTLQQDEVLEPVEVSGALAYPIATSLNGRVIETLYYRVDADTAWLVAHDPKKPLSLPLPVLRVGDGRVRWVHTGPTELADEPAPLTMKCESAPKGQRDVFGARRDLIELKIEAMVGGTGTSIRNVQTALYAKGIGLIEMRGEGKIGTQSTKFERKLIKFEAGGGDPS